jgi:hypothetical protein
MGTTPIESNLPFNELLLLRLSTSNAFSGEWVCWNGVHFHAVHFYYSSHRARIQYQLMSHQSDSTRLNIWLKFCSRPASFLWISNAIDLPIHTRTVGAMLLSTYINTFRMSQIIIEPVPGNHFTTPLRH